MYDLIYHINGGRISHENYGGTIWEAPFLNLNLISRENDSIKYIKILRSMPSGPKKFSKYRPLISMKTAAF